MLRGEQSLPGTVMKCLEDGHLSGRTGNFRALSFHAMRLSGVACAIKTPYESDRNRAAMPLGGIPTR